MTAIKASVGVGRVGGLAVALGIGVAIGGAGAGIAASSPGESPATEADSFADAGAGPAGGSHGRRPAERAVVPVEQRRAVRQPARAEVKLPARDAGGDSVPPAPGAAVMRSAVSAGVSEPSAGMERATLRGLLETGDARFATFVRSGSATGPTGGLLTQSAAPSVPPRFSAALAVGELVAGLAPPSGSVPGTPAGAVLPWTATAATRRQFGLVSGVIGGRPAADAGQSVPPAQATRSLGLVSSPIPAASPGRTRFEWANGYAFAALRADGSVVAWGNPDFGGDTVRVATQLGGNVVQVYSSGGAFAALKSDGSVVSWGSPDYGGDSGAVSTRLLGGVTAIYSTVRAFAALKDDGSVVTWGNPAYGGDSTSVAGELRDSVSQIVSTAYAFAATKTNGSVIAWGNREYGGDIQGVASRLLDGVTDVYSNGFAFAAVKRDGSVVTWGSPSTGGDSSGVASQLAGGVKGIAAANEAFAAIKNDGSVVAWGSYYYGANTSKVASQLRSGVAQVVGSFGAFAALKLDGSVVTWGNPDYGGDIGLASSRLRAEVTGIYATSSAFAALKRDGSVVTWGSVGLGGDSGPVSGQLSSSVARISSTAAAFAAVKSDGSVVTWGDSGLGGDSTAVAGQLREGVMQISSSHGAFAALKSDGSVVVWGDASRGGNGSNVANQLAGGVFAIADPFRDDRLRTSQPPVISNSSVTSVDASNGAVRGVVVANDPNNDQLSYSATTSGGGKVTVSANGGFIYVPAATARHAAAKNGAEASAKNDVFTVTVTDTDGMSTSQEIRVPISPANRVPSNAKFVVKSTDTATGVVTGTVSASDGDRDALTYTARSSTAKGSVSIDSATGYFTYTPSVAARQKAGRTDATVADKADNFTVTISDGYGGSASVDVAVTIVAAGINSAPRPGKPEVIVNTSSGVVTGNVNAVDPDGDTLTYSAVTAATAKGRVSVTVAGAFTYTPTAAARHEAAKTGALGAVKSDTFTVTVSDGRGSTASIPVTVMVSARNTSPSGVRVTILATDPQTGEVTGTISASDADRDSLAFTGPSSTTKGSVILNPVTGTFKYTPSNLARLNAAKTGAPAADKSDTFTVAVVDGYGGSTSIPITVAIRPTNTAPVAGNPVLSTDAVTGVVTGQVNALDAEGDPVTYAPASFLTGRGRVVITATGSFTYTPTPSARHAAARNNAAASTKTDFFTVNASDGFGGVASIPIAVNVTPQNSAPTVGAQLALVPDVITGAVTGIIVATDADGDILSYTGTTNTPSGKVTVAGDGSFTYTPTSKARAAATATTTDAFTVTASDGYGGVVSVPITVKILPAPTIVVGIPNLTTGVVNGSVTAPISESGPFTYTAPSISARGTLTIDSGSGAFVYTPTTVARHRAAALKAPREEMEDSFVVTIADSLGIVRYAALVKVPVKPQNVSPTGTASAGVLDPATAVINGTTTGFDLDGDTLTYGGGKILPEGKLTVDSSTGAFTYTPVSRVDTVTRVITGFSGPAEVVFSPDGARAYVSNSKGRTISVIDTAGQAIVGNLGNFSSPTSLAVAPNGRFLYVVDQTSVTVVDTSTGVIAGQVSGVTAPVAIGISPDGTIAYVAAKSTTYIVDLATNTVVRSLQISGGRSVVFTADGRKAYIGSYVVDTATEKVATTSSGSAPGVLGLDGSMRYKLGSKGEVFLVDTETQTDLGRAKIMCANCATGQTVGTVYPRGIAVSPDGETVYAVNPGHGAISVVTRWVGPTTETFEVTISDGHGGKASVPVTVNFTG